MTKDRSLKLLPLRELKALSPCVSLISPHPVIAPDVEQILSAIFASLASNVLADAIKYLLLSGTLFGVGFGDA